MKNRMLCNSRGFTLVELLVVMVILGLLAAVVAPKLMPKVKKGRQVAAQTQIELFGTALDSLALDAGRYPTTSEGLNSLMVNPGMEGWDGPYLKKALPNDPWSNPYQYKSPGTRGDYEIVSLGRDKQTGGEGENKDIVSWE